MIDEISSAMRATAISVFLFLLFPFALLLLRVPNLSIMVKLALAIPLIPYPAYRVIWIACMIAQHDRSTNGAVQVSLLAFPILAAIVIPLKVRVATRTWVHAGLTALTLFCLFLVGVWINDAVGAPS